MVTTGTAVAGRVLGGRYAVGPALGVGASATVHEAIDTTLGRRVAVKVLHAALAADEGFLARFRAEARAAAALSHPNILRVYDWGEGPERPLQSGEAAPTGPWLVSELMTGGSLRDLLDRGHLLSIGQARRLGAEAASALDHAHRRGLVHRDIKPANLLFDEDGRVVIADFGLARALAEAAVTEPSGALLGTARYASPEQARGLSVDGRADVYALALVLVEAVTGNVPFSADTTIATLMARVGNDLHPPVDLGPLVPALARAGRSMADTRSDAGRLSADLSAVAGEVGRADRLPITLASTPRTQSVRAADPADVTEHGAPMPAVAATRTGPRRRFGPALRVLSFLAALALVATGVVVSGVFVPTRVVPSVVDASERAAVAELQTRGLKGEVTRRVYRDGTQPGQVLDQNPDSGAARKANKPVELIVSRGPPPVAVPNLGGGRTEQEALALLEGAGLVVGERASEYSAHPRGIVINWEPNSGEVPRGSKVNIVVSDGPPPVPVPDFFNQPVDQAVRELRRLGLEPVREKVFHDTVTPGFVVSTSPAAGQEAPHGSKVTIKESQGPELIAVPDVQGKTVEQARSALEAAGLKVGDIFGERKRGHVKATDPEAGEKVRRGTSVDLFVP
ncbi:MAG TPA: PASTA domain-containing protein [Acidimicrobiales bacterium]|nr:PASTA domain-containing protein [Acidimicrobiales bacterium]